MLGVVGLSIDGKQTDTASLQHISCPLQQLRKEMPPWMQEAVLEFMEIASLKEKLPWTCNREPRD